MKHEIDQGALNDASWKFVEEYEKRIASQCPPILFNHIKGILEPAIQHYLLKSGLAEPAPKTYKIGQRFKVDDKEQILAQVLPWKVCLVSLDNGNRHFEPIQVRDISEITEKEMMKITAGCKYEVI